MPLERLSLADSLTHTLALCVGRGGEAGDGTSSWRGTGEAEEEEEDGGETRRDVVSGGGR